MKELFNKYPGVNQLEIELIKGKAVVLFLNQEPVHPCLHIFRREVFKSFLVSVDFTEQDLENLNKEITELLPSLALDYANDECGDLVLYRDKEHNFKLTSYSRILRLVKEFPSGLNLKAK